LRLIVAFLLPAISAFAADWPRFRGPNGSGIAGAGSLPAEFGAKKNLIWKVKAPAGTSSPIVAGGKVFLTSFDKEDRLLICLDAKTGRELWRRSHPRDRQEAFHPLNGPTTPSPVVEGSNVYVFFPEIGLISYDHNGGLRWKTPLGPFHSVQGLASSPIYADGLVMLAIDQTQDSFLAAFDAVTGKQRWQAPRPSNQMGGYSSPVVFQPKDGPAQVVYAGAIEIAGYQIQTGERLWWLHGISAATAATPVLHGDLLYSNEPIGAEAGGPFSILASFDKNKDGRLTKEEIQDPGMIRLLMGIEKEYGDNDGQLDEKEWDKFREAAKDIGGMTAIKLNGHGDLSKTGIRWRLLKSIPYLTSSLLFDGVLYSIRDGGILSSINPDTGVIHKQGRLEGAMDKYYASPVAGDGKLYLTSEQGKIAVVKAGPQWELLAVNDLEEQTYATPALANGRIYIRTRPSLYCFGLTATLGQ
jgi:outer membrane protein assembly factor BamB